MQIRELQENEVDSLFDALKSSAIENGVESKFTGDKTALKDALFKEKHSRALVIEKDKELIGHLLYSKTERNFTFHKSPGFYIHSLYVSKPHRRQKVGTRLMESLIKMAKDKGYSRMEFALLRNNKNGQLFLDSLNFKEVDIIKPMRLTLN